MLRFEDLEPLRRAFARSPYLAIGTFDGVHRGHRAVIAALLARARGDGAPAAVVTFTPHPAAVLDPAGAPPLLSDYATRAALIAALGVDALVEVPFTAAFAAVTAAAFVQDHLCRRAGARRVFVGADFTFGARAAGSPDTLAVLGRQACGLETTVVPLLHAEGAPVSSTRIRAALREGRPALAARLLGRPFALRGAVVEGEHRGAGLGFPTANLLPPPGLALPALGVYAVRCRVEGEEGPDRPAVANLGRRPTVDGTDVRLEVHLLGYAGDLYGRALEVSFVRRLRGERRFRSTDELRRQIGHDAARATTLLGARPAPR
jgi:riboflavin kinase/FMN adenylyltransferase